MSETARLAEFGSHLTRDTLPDEVASRVGLVVLDTVGIAVRAMHDAESTPALLQAARATGQSGGSARIMGSDETFTPLAAAMINGTLAHSLDFDDTHAAGSIHPSAPIVPAALAAAEMTGADGNLVVTAIAAGYETQIRLSLALDPSAHYRRGYHPSATCGVFGAAVAAGRIFGLDPLQMERAIGIAGCQTSGSIAVPVRRCVGPSASRSAMPRTMACWRQRSRARASSVPRARSRGRTGSSAPMRRNRTRPGRRCGPRLGLGDAQHSGQAPTRRAGTAMPRWERSRPRALPTTSSPRRWRRSRSGFPTRAGGSSARTTRSSARRPGRSTASSRCRSAARWCCARGPWDGTTTPGT